MDRAVHKIPNADMGIRTCPKFIEPYKFNIIVNDMADVIRHEDAQRYSGTFWGCDIQGALSGDSYHVLSQKKWL